MNTSHKERMRRNINKLIKRNLEMENDIRARRDSLQEHESGSSSTERAYKKVLEGWRENNETPERFS